MLGSTASRPNNRASTSRPFAPTVALQLHVPSCPTVVLQPHGLLSQQQYFALRPLPQGHGSFRPTPRQRPHPPQLGHDAGGFCPSPGSTMRRMRLCMGEEPQASAQVVEPCLAPPANLSLGPSMQTSNQSSEALLGGGLA